MPYLVLGGILVAVGFFAGFSICGTKEMGGRFVLGYTSIIANTFGVATLLSFFFDILSKKEWWGQPCLVLVSIGIGVVLTMLVSDLGFNWRTNHLVSKFMRRWQR